MTSFFAKFPGALAALGPTHTFVTANERLASELRRAYDLLAGDRLAQTDGAAAWTPLRCFSMQQYFRQQLSRAQDLGLTGRRLLPDSLLLQTAMQCQPGGQLSSQLIENFLRAWHLLHRHRINTRAAPYDEPRLQPFSAWVDAVRAALPEQYVAEEQIPELLAELQCWTQRPLLLDHIDQLSPLEQHYFAAAAAHQPVVQRHSPQTGLPDWGGEAEAAGGVRSSRLYACQSLRQEVAAAAGWAYRCKAAQADALIGIVVPNLTRHYDMVKRQVGEILDPAAGSLSFRFEISAGVPLARHSVWREARLLLTLCSGQISSEQLQQLAYARSLQLRAWRRRLQPWPGQLGRTVSLQGWTALEDSPAALSALCESWPRTAPLADWVAHFLQVLWACGWPNASDAQSVQYQASEALTNNLMRASRSGGSRPLPATEALALLELMLERVMFAPQSTRADIRVLGMLETTGLEFSHLWICGMDENSFPAQPLNNPFVPPAVAVRYGIPRATPAQELDLARRQLRDWRRSTTFLRLSYTHTIEDSPQQASLLLQSLQAKTLDSKARHPYWQTQPRLQLQAFSDANGPALDTSHAPLDTPGGAALLQAQASCPFKAFARYRLRLRSPLEAADLPDALQRGVLLHRALELLMSEFPGSEALNGVGANDVAKLCAEALQQLPRPLPRHYREHEIKRLSSLLNRWIELELERGPFTTLHLEKTFALQVGSLRLQIRVDRIDSSDGHWVVLDYKSGKVSLSNSRTLAQDEPQLPVYSLADAKIRGVYFAQVHQDNMRLLGVSDPDAQLHNSRVLPAEADWQQTRNHWRRDLEKLAEDYADGRAAPRPSAAACAQCHLGGVCRVPFQR